MVDPKQLTSTVLDRSRTLQRHFRRGERRNTTIAGSLLAYTEAWMHVPVSLKPRTASPDHHVPPLSSLPRIGDTTGVHGLPAHTAQARQEVEHLLKKMRMGSFAIKKKKKGKNEI